MISAFVNCLKIPELRQRILLTLGLVCVVRLGTHLPLPGLNPIPLEEAYNAAKSSQSGGGVLNLLNLFTGGALKSGSILALGDDRAGAGIAMSKHVGHTFAYRPGQHILRPPGQTGHVEVEGNAGIDTGRAQ